MSNCSATEATPPRPLEGAGELGSASILASHPDKVVTSTAGRIRTAAEPASPTSPNRGVASTTGDTQVVEASAPEYAARPLVRPEPNGSNRETADLIKPTGRR